MCFSKPRWVSSRASKPDEPDFLTTKYTKDTKMKTASSPARTEPPKFNEKSALPFAVPFRHEKTGRTVRFAQDDGEGGSDLFSATGDYVANATAFDANNAAEAALEQTKAEHAAHKTANAELHAERVKLAGMSEPERASYIKAKDEAAAKAAQ
jgi:hypothetical protein